MQASCSGVKRIVKHQLAVNRARTASLMCQSQSADRTVRLFVTGQINGPVRVSQCVKVE